MSLVDLLTQQISGQALEGLSKQLGVPEGQASSAISAALPMIVGAMAKNASSQGGAEALAGAINRDHDGSILDNLGGFLASSDNGSGAGILKHVLGGKRGMVEQSVGQMSGMDAGKVGALLENLAPLVMGYLGRQKRSQGLDAGGLASILLGERNNQAQGSGSAAIDMISNILDRDGDGSMLDDIGGMLGGFFGKK